ncbi:hypothetical protein MHLP_00790 [Candidatus Mycoplasma haematolamae str. Purdue]|uniref:Uncharacterized protein n=1 Tax=Mycoplasma haematolamae (strain Purdue) TaxID=1212765 RepID=I7BIT7_MYCHA|nr:hypothetical protein [Candidatus Mycoplasma haematolamae]AFO51738.1 hypothetical protein MHLP_00790 [Candidatus Mycoplasma haematolamae str. Purdue]
MLPYKVVLPVVGGTLGLGSAGTYGVYEYYQSNDTHLKSQEQQAGTSQVTDSKIFQLSKNTGTDKVNLTCIITPKDNKSLQLEFERVSEKTAELKCVEVDSDKASGSLKYYDETLEESDEQKKQDYEKRKDDETSSLKCSSFDVQSRIWQCECDKPFTMKLKESSESDPRVVIEVTS